MTLHTETVPCPCCKGEGAFERLAIPQEVDAGCELGEAFDPCQRCGGKGTETQWKT